MVMSAAFNRLKEIMISAPVLHCHKTGKWPQESYHYIDKPTAARLTMLALTPKR